MTPNSMTSLIATIIFLALCSSSCHSQASVKTLLNSYTDEAALLSFKSQVTDDPNHVLDTWNKNSSICSWYGVVCNNKKTRTRVTGLTLENNTLTGFITPHVTNLSFLRILNLESNHFHGVIPVDIGKLFRLETLNLASNNIDGQIPSSLGSCSRLRVINFSKNKLEGTIPHDIGNLVMLQDLSFNGNKLTGLLPSSFGNLSSLNNLILQSNYLHGPVPTELGRLRRLLQLDIGLNIFSGELPSSLFNLSSLILMVLVKNRLSGYLPPDLFMLLPNLSTMFVGGNSFKGPLPSSLSNATNLERADFSVNEFTGQVPLLWNVPNIIILNLEINRLSSEGQHGLDFITSLTNSTSLQVFSLATNQFTGKLPSSLGNLSSQLSLLAIGENHFEGTIPESVGNLGGLTLLSLQFNSFTGNIPSSIGKLQNLQNLLLDLNSLYGLVPESLGNLTQLYELGLSSNNLSGSIPMSLSNCHHIQVLDLSKNNFSSSIPKEMFSFPSLGTLINFSFNSLTGPLPYEVGNLKMVQGIDVSKNKLSGSIPSSIGQCSNLLYLDISGNLFEGGIPSSLSNLKGVEYVDLSSNNLSGSIPNSLGSLKYLKLLNLSSNELQGEVPQLGIFRNTSGVFVNDNSGLCGGVTSLGLSKCAMATKGHSHRSRRALIVGVSTSASICLVIVVFFLVIVLKERMMQQGSSGTKVISFDGPRRLYSYYNLKHATNNFSPETLIGRGSFGIVYKGALSDGTVVAVKVFDTDQTGAFKSFIAECEALKNIRHRNLVKIISACSTPSFKALVLQFMPNGSLESWLHHDTKDSRSILSLKQRLEIALDVSSALEYLHHDCTDPVVHCDLKPSNVLLDQKMTAHVGDFGLAKILHETVSVDRVSSTLALKGSIGYIAPEYGIGGQVSTKGDVYSFGILVLEMLTGKRPSEETFVGEFSLQKWVQASIPNEVLKILDDDLKEELHILKLDHLVSVLEMGLQCANEKQEMRPQMKDVSKMIRKLCNVILNDDDDANKILRE